MPFRSEEVVLRERIRRAEEDAAVLRERQTELRNELGARHRKRNAWLVFSIGVAGAGLAGWGGGYIAVETHLRSLSGAEMARSISEFEDQRSAITECQSKEARASSDLRACERSLAEKQRAQFNRPIDPTKCVCPPNDPLCVCPFDQATSADALTAAQAPIRGCFVPSRSLSFHAKLNFVSRTGAVDTADIDSSDGNLTPAEHACVLAVLHRVKVPTFDGAAVTVGKSYFVRPQ